MKKIIFLFLMSLIGCQNPTQFSTEALQEKFINISQQEESFKNILSKHKGNKLLIDVWASWCSDCIETLPILKNLQTDNPDVHVVFLSLDRSLKNWKKGIERFQISGDHYYMREGKKGAFGDFLNLWWIPRYLVVNESGEITLFKATKISDKKILEALKK
jgi:thiol-disulfide isomerase/thioredoxin|tara:strand:+ start:144 stop:623 length:480 start_codon:yes stop_codon:yes gene_type:complete